MIVSGDRIKALRIEKKIQQGEFAKKVGISRTFMSDIERGKKQPSSKTLLKIGEVLEIDSVYLIERGDLISNYASPIKSTKGYSGNELLDEEFITDEELFLSHSTILEYEGYIYRYLPHEHSQVYITIMNELFGLVNERKNTGKLNTKKFKACAAILKEYSKLVADILIIRKSPEYIEKIKLLKQRTLDLVKTS